MKNSKQSFMARGGAWVLAQFVLLLLMLFIPQWTALGRFGMTEPWQWLGALLIALGLALTVAAMMALGRSLTPFPRPLEGARLMQDGVYGFVRHPIYSGIFIAAIGWAFMWASVAGVIFAFVLGAFFDRKSAREEDWLRRRYKPYRRYQRRVKKMIPWVY